MVRVQGLGWESLVRFDRLDRILDLQGLGFFIATSKAPKPLNKAMRLQVKVLVGDP